MAFDHNSESAQAGALWALVTLPAREFIRQGRQAIDASHSLDPYGYRKLSASSF